ncbi:MAG: hypothetical protein ACRDGO_08340 [Actinomycetota bacterium]
MRWCVGGAILAMAEAEYIWIAKAVYASFVCSALLRSQHPSFPDAAAAPSNLNDRSFACRPNVVGPH